MLVIRATTIMLLDRHLPVARLCPVPRRSVGTWVRIRFLPGGQASYAHPHAPSLSSLNTTPIGAPTPVSGSDHLHYTTPFCLYLVARASPCEPPCPCCQFVPVIEQPTPRGHNQRSPSSRATATGSPIVMPTIRRPDIGN